MALVAPVAKPINNSLRVCAFCNNLTPTAAINNAINTKRVTVLSTKPYLRTNASADTSSNAQDAACQLALNLIADQNHSNVYSTNNAILKPKYSVNMKADTAMISKVNPI